MTETLIAACPVCNTLNRMPREKLAAGPTGRCGQCRSPLFGRDPMTLSAASFESHALRSDIPLLIDFWAPWCGPCKAMEPQFEKAANHLEPSVRLAKVNSDDEQELAAQFSISGVPTMILLKHGKEIARRSGLMDAASIEQWAAQILRK